MDYFNLIKRLREKLILSQTEFANLLEVSFVTSICIIKNKSNL